MDNEKQLNLTNLPSTLMSSTISPETSREFRSYKRQREEDLSSDGDDDEKIQQSLDLLLQSSVQLSMAAKMLSNSGENSSTESLLKKAARAYLIHILQSQEQPSPISKSILSDAFDIETFDFKVFQDMCGRPLSDDDIRQVMFHMQLESSCLKR